MKKATRITLLLICFLFCFGFSSTAQAANHPAQVKNVKVSNYSKTRHKLTWNRVKGASGYQIFCKDFSVDYTKYKRVLTVKGGTRKSCIIKGRKTGRAYAYIVRAYKKVNGRVYFGKFSSYVYGYIPGTTAPDRDETTAGTGNQSGSQTENQSGTQGGTQTGDQSGTQGGTQTGDVSNSQNGTVTVPVDNRILINPSTSQKYQKIFGDSALSMRYPGGYYTSSGQAQANMTSITVKTWDFAPGGSGEKITRTWTISVHKNLASTVSQIFKEIYEGKEKFPIHELGGYAWRGGHSEHNTGTAIDINWTENYMVNVATGVITCGKYWKPGIDPYSIPKDGEVARIFNKYGFKQGDWGNSKDYMHFSYFGT